MVAGYQAICNFSFTSVGLIPMDGCWLKLFVAYFCRIKPTHCRGVLLLNTSVIRGLTMDVSSTFTLMQILDLPT